MMVAILFENPSACGEELHLTALVFSLEGYHTVAEGNAPGSSAQIILALKIGQCISAAHD